MSKKQQNSLPPAYSSSEYEGNIYAAWEQSGYFNPDALPGERTEAFSVMMPPPNVTGVLHLGHALENALLDTKVRFERMCGKRALLVPGTDHAAVATQARVENDLVETGIKNPRAELGREKLLSIIREYAEKSRMTILSQIRSLGTSCDWSRLAYTFDEARSKAVNEAFRMLYNDGLIYRGHRVVNWSVKGQSTASDEELVYVEQPTKLYTMRYGADFPIPIATTRPETKLGDTAVAVHPDDARYKKYIGKAFTVDVGAAYPLGIRVIADAAVDPTFGTGAVGVTPAHSMADFELKERHGLELMAVIGTDGRMMEAAGPLYAGLPVSEARKKFVVWLQKKKLIEKVEDITHSVATSDRFGDVIEVLPMLQWFVAVNKEIPGRNKTLKDLMREAGEQIEITPERFRKIYYQWIDNLRDWCISRQIWWGHRIPVWYCSSGHTVVSVDEPHVDCEKCGNRGFVAETDTLDTWFSSGLWTFSTLGWPQTKAGRAPNASNGKTEDLARFHPTSWMQMGYEIVFFWMARMILMSTYVLKEIPFRSVYIHGLVRDKGGKKFSKSLRNTMDPIEMIRKYGTDALRMSLLSGVTPGNDVTFYEKKIEHYQHFVNKLWNISRYVFGTVDFISVAKKEPRPDTDTDRWILKRLDSLIDDVTTMLDGSDFSLAAARLYQFMWYDFADWYIEVSKIEAKRSIKSKKTKDEILLYVLQVLLRLLHPYTPFVTEVLWKQFSTGTLIMIADWPKKKYSFPATAGEKFSQAQKDILVIREHRSQHKISAASIVNVRMRHVQTEYKDVIEKIARCTIEITDVNEVVVESISTLTEVKRTKLEAYAAALEKKLANKAFVKNAPAAVVAQDRKKLAEAKKKLGE